MRTSLFMASLLLLAAPAFAREYDHPPCIHLPSIPDPIFSIHEVGAPEGSIVPGKVSPSWHRDLGSIAVGLEFQTYAPLDIPAPRLVRRFYPASISEGLPMR